MSQANLLILVAVTLPPRSLNGLGDVLEERVVETPFGPVGPVALRGDGRGAPVWVLPYSGLPTRTDPRATVYAARELGVDHLLNWDEGIAVNPVLRRGQAVLPVDYIDFTRSLPGSFAADVAASPGMDAPDLGRFAPSPAFAPKMVALLAELLPSAPGITYLGVDGPRRETPAEARMFRAWGADVLGQNLIPEVFLAQELGLAYAGLVTVLDSSADQRAPDPRGELREGLEWVTSMLPRLVQRLAAPDAPQNQG
jgi:5'-methylthioadenosine phosphorylase